MLNNRQTNAICCLILIFVFIYTSECRPLSVQKENEIHQDVRNNTSNKLHNEIKDLKVPKLDFPTTTNSNLMELKRKCDLLIPKINSQDLLDNDSVLDILQYMYQGYNQVQNIENIDNRRMMEKTYYETVSNFIQNILLPIAKYSYYSGKVELKSVRHIMDFFKLCVEHLHMTPIKKDVLTLQELQSESLDKVSNKNVGNFSQVICLDYDLSPIKYGKNTTNDGKLIVELPKLDVHNKDGVLSNIWIPFVQKHNFNLRSDQSDYILIDYYRGVQQCYREKGLSQKAFDQYFQNWIHENLENHLTDNEFYPGLGGILNLYDNLKNAKQKKTITKRNVNEKTLLIVDKNKFNKRHVLERLTYDDQSDENESTIENDLNFLANNEEKVDCCTDEMKEPKPRPFFITCWRKVVICLLKAFGLILLIYIFLLLITRRIDLIELITKFIKCDFIWTLSSDPSTKGSKKKKAPSKKTSSKNSSKKSSKKSKKSRKGSKR